MTELIDRPQTDYRQVFTDDVPEHVPQHLVRDFDIYGLSGDDPQAALKELQRTHPPIFYTPRLRGYWVVTLPRYINEAFLTPELFSSATIQLPKEASHAVAMLPAESDDPEHKKYRQIINGPLGPRSIMVLTEKLRRDAAELIESVRHRGRCDFVGEIAQRFPINAFLGLYGLPMQDRAQLLDWSHRIVQGADIAARREAVDRSYEYLLAAAEKRRAMPTEDLLSTIVHGSVDGHPLAREQMLGMLFTVMIGGLDTIAEAMAISVRFLAKSALHRRQLVEDPKLIPLAIEELMRRFGANFATRIAKTDFIFKDVHVKRDDQFFLPLPLVSLDEEVAPRPMDVDFKRRGARNANFGVGVHRCAGMHLARLEMRIFFEEWLARIPEFTLAAGVNPPIEVSQTTMYMKELPITWG